MVGRSVERVAGPALSFQGEEGNNRFERGPGEDIKAASQILQVRMFGGTTDRAIMGCRIAGTVGFET